MAVFIAHESAPEAVVLTCLGVSFASIFQVSEARIFVFPSYLPVLALFRV